MELSIKLDRRVILGSKQFDAPKLLDDNFGRWNLGCWAHGEEG